MQVNVVCPSRVRCSEAFTQRNRRMKTAEILFLPLVILLHNDPCRMFHLLCIFISPPDSFTEVLHLWMQGRPDAPVTGQQVRGDQQPSVPVKPFFHASSLLSIDNSVPLSVPRSVSAKSSRAQPSCFAALCQTHKHTHTRTYTECCVFCFFFSAAKLTLSRGPVCL